MTIDIHAGLTLDDFLGAITPDLDRPIVNKTGIAGLYKFRLVYAPDERAARFERDTADPPASAPTGPSIFSAMQQQLGLKLTPAKGPGARIVVDRVEKPSEN